MNLKVAEPMGKVANKINGKRKTELRLAPSQEVAVTLKRNRCAQCDNWDIEGRPPGMGLCRATSPQLIMENGLMRAYWPVISKDEWCGTFKAKETEQ